MNRSSGGGEYRKNVEQAKRKQRRRWRDKEKGRASTALEDIYYPQLIPNEKEKKTIKSPGHLIKNGAKDWWHKKIGDFSVTLMDSRHVLIKLMNDMDYVEFLPISYIF
ncbi:hypothetical protein IEQ34_014130 [Dendrobium chrysotoxum]|uniref:Uncharacterized protein n=1 Tax=Dendrobium chrysotoxum TaxID=161865 RepID=A0AAV7GKM8_DENCH|nr:hypothetical protein IEQ34_014130 [Dendrobium chrysotoxum]